MARVSSTLPGSVDRARICPRCRLAPPVTASSARRSTSARRSAIRALGLFLLGQLVLQVGGLLRAALVRAALRLALGVAGALGLLVRACGEDRAQLLGGGLVGSHPDEACPKGRARYRVLGGCSG